MSEQRLCSPFSLYWINNMFWQLDRARRSLGTFSVGVVCCSYFTLNPYPLNAFGACPALPEVISSFLGDGDPDGFGEIAISTVKRLSRNHLDFVALETTRHTGRPAVCFNVRIWTCPVNCVAHSETQQQALFFPGSCYRYSRNITDSKSAFSRQKSIFSVVIK